MVVDDKEKLCNTFMSVQLLHTKINQKSLWIGFSSILHDSLFLLF